VYKARTTSDHCFEFDVQVVTFGAPLIFTKEEATEFETIKGSIHNIVNGYDIVPRIFGRHDLPANLPPVYKQVFELCGPFSIPSTIRKISRERFDAYRRKFVGCGSFYLIRNFQPPGNILGSASLYECKDAAGVLSKFPKSLVHWDHAITDHFIASYEANIAKLFA
jgi:hypothetical protein